MVAVWTGGAVFLVLAGLLVWAAQVALRDRNDAMGALCAGLFFAMSTDIAVLLAAAWRAAGFP